MGDEAQRTDKTVRMLVVNDDSLIRTMVREMLHVEGYHDIEMAEDRQQALAVLRRSRVPYVVLLDDIMPVMGGMEVLEAVAVDSDLAARTAWVYMAAPHRSESLADTPLLRHVNAQLLPYPFTIWPLIQAVEEAAASLSMQ